MTINLHEDQIAQLTDLIKQAEPHIEALHLRIINQGCRAAWEKLTSLSTAASEMLDYIHQQDFMNIDRYADMEKGLRASYGHIRRK
jgi:hypothetical protein